MCRAPWPDPFGMESEEDICNSWSTDRSGGTGSSSLCEAVVNRAEMTDCEVTLFRLGGHALLEERGANGYTAALVPAGMCGKWYDGALRNGANALKGRHAHARRRVWTMLLSDVAVASSETVRWVQRDLKQIYVSILAITFAAPLVYALVQAVKIVCARRLYTGMFEYGVIREGDVEIGCISGRRRFRRDELDCVRVVEKGVEFVYGGVETVLWIEETYSKWVAERLDGLVESERGKRMFDDAGRAHASRRVLRDTVLPESGADSEIWLRRRGTHVRIVHMRNGAGVFLTHIAFVWAIWVAYMAANVAVKTRAGEERFWHDVIEIALLVVFVLLTPFVCGRFVRTWCVGRGHVCEKDLEVVREKVVDRGRCVGGNRYGCVLACGHGRVAEVGGLTRGDAGRVAKAVRGVVAGAAEDGEEV